MSSMDNERGYHIDHVINIENTKNEILQIMIVIVMFIDHIRERVFKNKTSNYRNENDSIVPKNTFTTIYINYEL